MKYLTILLLLSSHSFAATFELKPGLWRLETEVDIPSGEKSVQETLPQKEEEPSLTEMCITDDESSLEKSLVKDGQCKFVNITQNREELKGDILCTQKRTGKARWKKISEDEFIMTMETHSGTSPVRLTQRGKFIQKECQQG